MTTKIEIHCNYCYETESEIDEIRLRRKLENNGWKELKWRGKSWFCNKKECQDSLERTLIQIKEKNKV